MRERGLGRRLDGGVAWLALTLLVALALMPRPASGEDFCGRDILISGTMTLDAVGFAGFSDKDLPRWPVPYAGNRSTGIRADSCIPVVNNVLTAQDYRPVGWTPPALPSSTVTVPYRTLRMPSFGGSYVLQPRMQLGNPHLGVACPGPGCKAEIAEDFYVFDSQPTACVRYCPCPGKPPVPSLPPPGTCGVQCQCDPNLCQGDCNLPPDQPVYTQQVDFTERVAFLSIRLWAGALPSPTCPAAGSSCCPSGTYETNPNAAALYIECRKDPASRWELKAGTEFGPYSWQTGTPWLNQDNCTQAEVDLLPFSWQGPPRHDPRVPIYFPFTALRECRIRGQVTLETCQGATDLEITKLVWPTSRHKDSNGFWYHDLGVSGPGQFLDVQKTLDNSSPSSSYYVTKICEVDDVYPPVPPPMYSSGHGGKCCGPEYGDLHGTLDLIDGHCQQRDIGVAALTMPLRSHKRMVLRRSVDRDHSICAAEGKLFKCRPFLPYDQDPGSPPPAFNDPSCGPPPTCAPWPPPPTPCDPTCGEWKFQDAIADSLPQANYDAASAVWEGDWWSTEAVEVVLKGAKNRLLMAPVTGLQGLLMDEDPAACAGDIVGDWNRPEDYPNYNDVSADLPSLVARGPGVRVTNQNRSVIDAANPADRLAFTICPASASKYGVLGDINGEPDFIRERDYHDYDKGANPPVYPSWLPDRTLDAETASVKGIVRLIDGSIDPVTGEVREIGLESPWTMRRFYGHPFYGDTPAGWKGLDPCFNFPAPNVGGPSFDIRWNVSELVSFATHASTYSTSNAGAPEGDTVLQYFWPHPLVATQPDKPHRCSNEVIDECACGRTDKDWPRYFGMPELKDPTDTTFQGFIKSLLPVPFTDGETYGRTETDYHFDQILALTNNMKASVSNRQLRLEFFNNRAESGIDKQATPVFGQVILHDVTKPFQPGRNAFDGLPLPPSFNDPSNVMWPYLVKLYDGSSPRKDSEVDPRVGNDQDPSPGDPWCDTTADTDPVPGLHPYNHPQCAYQGRTLVDRYTAWPGDCKVENLGVCLGEVRFIFDANTGNDRLFVEGGGYLNALQDPAPPSTRPDLVTHVSRPPIVGDFADVNEDGVPDQYLTAFSFERPAGMPLGDSRTVVAYLPAGRYTATGYLGFDKRQPKLPIPELCVKCGGLSTTRPRITVFNDSCSEDGSSKIRGEVYAPTCPQACVLQGATWFNSTTRTGGTLLVSGANPNWDLVGKYGQIVTALAPGCNHIEVSATFANCEAASADINVVFDDVPPVLTCGSASCSPSVSVSAHATDQCRSAAACPGATTGTGGLSRYQAELLDTLGNVLETKQCDVASPDCTFSSSRGCGQYRVRWTAVDLAGNSASCLSQVTVSDGTQPVARLSAPPDPAIDPATCGVTVTVDYTVDDGCGLGIGSLTWTVLRPGSPPQLIPVVPPLLGGSLTETFPCGTSQVTLEAVDSCGNRGSSSVSITPRIPEPTLEGHTTICGMKTRPAGECLTCDCYSLTEVFRRSLAAHDPWFLNLAPCLTGVSIDSATFTNVFQPPYENGQVLIPSGGCTNPRSPVSWNGGDQVCIRYAFALHEVWSYVNGSITVKYTDCAGNPQTRVITSLPGDPLHWPLHVPARCSDCTPILTGHMPPYGPCTSCP